MKLILFLAIYFVPSIISITNKHPSAIFIVPLNLFLGWTVVGWIVALVWSVKGGNNEVRTYPLKHNIAKINSMKHACKCYMEMLTPGEQRVAIMLARELSFKDYF